MIENKKWFAFFSHTGSEIYNISKRLGRFPDKIITNKSPGDDIHPGLLEEAKEILYTSHKPGLSDYDRVMARCTDCICTLHGWMRIVPKRICEEYEMYNLHPGLITRFPELKGKDPQSRVDSEKHDKIGLVIHKVTSGVDEGPILIEVSSNNSYHSASTVTARLHDMALDAWSDFFTHYEALETT